MTRLSIAALALLAALASTFQAAPAHGQAATVRELIAEYAAAYGAPVALLDRIARCESSYGTHWRTNHPSNPHRGIFQWERASWAEVAPQIGVSGDFDEAYAVPSNVAVAAYSVAIGRAWRWRACW